MRLRSAGAQQGRQAEGASERVPGASRGISRARTGRGSGGGIRATLYARPGVTTDGPQGVTTHGGTMRDKHDRATADLLKTPAANRQAAYADRQRQAGRKQRSYWLTDDEAAAVAALLERLRGS